MTYMADYKTDVQKLLRELTAQGWVIVDNGHYRCVPPDRSKRIVFIAKTPSDWRGMLNMKQQLRRSGAQIK